MLLEEHDGDAGILLLRERSTFHTKRLFSKLLCDVGSESPCSTVTATFNRPHTFSNQEPTGPLAGIEKSIGLVLMGVCLGAERGLMTFRIRFPRATERLRLDAGGDTDKGHRTYVVLKQIPTL